MSRNRGSDTKPELMLRAALRARGVHYRLRGKLPGRPDIFLPRFRLAIFVDGCFWHGCPEHAVKPKTNAKFWQEKLSKNKARDEQVNRQLAELGWNVLRFWEHEIREALPECVGIIGKKLNSQPVKEPRVGNITTAS